MDIDQPRRRVRSYVLRAGRLSKGQQRAIEQFSKDYCIDCKDTLLDAREVFGNDHPLIIEIGFGMGDATSRIAEQFQDHNFIGIEVFTPGVGKLLGEINEKKLENIRIIQHDAVDVLSNMIADKSVAGFHIFFPDPWPKKKHHKRRLIQSRVVRLLRRKLKPGGYIYAVTDWQEYADQMLEVLSGEQGLSNRFDGFAEPVSWRPGTKFEQKGLNRDHRIRELWFVKRTGIE
jgi:tRNA (guanine-N7-)-methyltransferase